MIKIAKYLFLLLVLLFTCIVIIYTPKYAYRVLVWQESDYNDSEKFKFATIDRGQEEFNFHDLDEKKYKSELQRLAGYTENSDFIEFLNERGTYSFLVIRNDSILVEHYFQENTRETLQNTFSVSKSILSLAIIKAIELGKIKSVEEPITNYLPELYDRDQRFQDIRIGDLLRMRSGIKYSPKTTFPWLNRDNVLTYYFPDLRKVALQKTKIDHQTDLEFLYNNYNPLLLGLIMERANDISLSKFIEDHIWTQIGTEYAARWSTDERNFEKMESGFLATPIDLAKIGRLVLKEGRFNGRQVLSDTLLKEFTTSQSTIDVFEDRKWGYGHFWWTLPDETTNPPIMANGHMGQFIFINPKSNYIIIRNGLKVGQFYDDDWTEIFIDYTKE